jgi:ribosomal protein S18 acetylase RimI-like enzyme
MQNLFLLDENLRAAMHFFGTATGSGHVERFDSSVAIYSGLDYGVFNIGLLTEPVTLGAKGLEARLAECARYYRNRSPRWSFWLCEEYLDARTRRQARQIFQQANLRQISRAPAMIAKALRPSLKPPPVLECVPVHDRTTRHAFSELTTVCFDIPFNIAQSVYMPERAWNGAYQGYVGLLDRKPVSIAATVVQPGAIGIYSLGTLPEFRHRGFGETMLRAAVAQCPPGLPIVLESTDAGYPLYRRLGFEDVGNFTVYLTK